MAARSARVHVMHTATEDFGNPGGWHLLFQWCRYVFEDGETEEGYRFIWRRPESEGGSLQAARGQARIPSLDVAKKLMAIAEKEGWGGLDGSKTQA